MSDSIHQPGGCGEDGELRLLARSPPDRGRRWSGASGEDGGLPPQPGVHSTGAGGDPLRRKPPPIGRTSGGSPPFPLTFWAVGALFWT